MGFSGLRKSVTLLFKISQFIKEKKTKTHEHSNEEGTDEQTSGYVK